MTVSSQIDETAVARRLLQLATPVACPPGRPGWVTGSRHPGGGLDLAFRDDDFDPLGWSAPPECLLFAMVGTGRVRALDEGVELAANLVTGRAGGVRLACVVSRRGAVGWHMVLPDGSSFDRVPEEGRVLDVLKRCLGLPTPPPPVSPRRLHAAAWLAAVISLGEPARPLSWSEALDLHPALQGRGYGLDVAAKEHLIDLLGSRCSWEDLRMAVAAGIDTGPGLPSAHLAGWMDAGMFARWVLAALCDPDELLARARPNLHPAAARRVAHAVRSAG